jgi:hypothetical protein
MANPPIDIKALEEASQVTTDDPQLSLLQGSEEASPEQEQMLGEAMIGLQEFMYSEEGMAKIAQIFQQDERPLYQSVPDVAEMLLQKVHTDMSGDGEVDAAIFFGEGGLLQQLPPMLFEIAASLGKPGADDPDQRSAALIGTYKKAGEFILAKGDEDAVSEAARLGQEVLMTQDDGSLATPQQFMKQNLQSGKEDLPNRINQNLLGV